MLLIVTGSDDATADFLCQRLDREAVDYRRLDTDRAAVDGVGVTFVDGAMQLRLADQQFKPGDFAHVWYRRPRGVAAPREAAESHQLHFAREWGVALDGFLAQIPHVAWMNFPAHNARAGNKLTQLQVASQVGFSVPASAVTQSSETAQAFLEAQDGLGIVKPLHSGTIETAAGRVEAAIFTSPVTSAQVAGSASLSACPTLFQQRIAKALDVRVTVVDDQMLAMGLRSPTHELDIRRDAMQGVEYSHFELDARTQASIRQMMRRFDLRFAAIDLVVDMDDRVWFLEINPNGQWAWMDEKGATDIAALFVAAFSNRGATSQTVPAKARETVGVIRGIERRVFVVVANAFGAGLSLREALDCRDDGTQQPDKPDLALALDGRRLLAQAQRKYSEVNDRRRYVEEKAKTILSLVMFVPTAVGVVAALGKQHWILMFPIGLSLLTVWLLFEMFAIAANGAPPFDEEIVSAKDEQAEGRLLADAYVRAAWHNELRASYLVSVLMAARGLALTSAIALGIAIAVATTFGRDNVTSVKIVNPAVAAAPMIGVAQPLYTPDPFGNLWDAVDFVLATTKTTGRSTHP